MYIHLEIDLDIIGLFSPLSETVWFTPLATSAKVAFYDFSELLPEIRNSQSVIYFHLRQMTHLSRSSYATPRR